MRTKIHGNSDIAMEKIQSLKVGAAVMHSSDPRNKMIFKANLNTTYVLMLLRRQGRGQLKNVYFIELMNVVV